MGLSGPIIFRLWLLHRWLCRWHLDPNSDMQLWLQHLCLHVCTRLHMLALWNHLWFIIPGYSYQLDNSEILNPSKHHIAAAPLALMESLQSLLPAVLPCKHQRCVVPTCSNIGRRKLWQIVAKTAAIIAMVLNFLSALWMLLSPHPSSESENPPSTPRIPDFLAHTWQS